MKVRVDVRTVPSTACEAQARHRLAGELQPAPRRNLLVPDAVTGQSAVYGVRSSS